MDSNANYIQHLNSLLNPKNEDDIDDDDITSTGHNINPSHIGPPKKKTSNNQDEKKTNEKTKSKDIWDDSEVLDDVDIDDSLDPREQPEYDLKFSQSVSSEDVYLQMGQKNQSTASCENLMIKIKLPATTMNDVELQVTDTFLDLRSPKYKLALYLPHKVDSKNGKAQWDKAKEELNITLRVQREYDFLNM
ncbi:Protein PIH1D3 [Trichoplax sp. H2]|nr:Protein PIH1D3 [Trichoplax sp. H2]|eukprot:RDD46856.1 Protein PIH1D3 [Trichoplax sp. H2]